MGNANINKLNRWDSLFTVLMLLAAGFCFGLPQVAYRTSATWTFLAFLALSMATFKVFLSHSKVPNSGEKLVDETKESELPNEMYAHYLAVCSAPLTMVQMLQLGVDNKEVTPEDAHVALDSLLVPGVHRILQNTTLEDVVNKANALYVESGTALAELYANSLHNRIAFNYLIEE